MAEDPPLYARLYPVEESVEGSAQFGVPLQAQPQAQFGLPLQAQPASAQPPSQCVDCSAPPPLTLSGNFTPYVAAEVSEDEGPRQRAWDESSSNEDDDTKDDPYCLRGIDTERATRARLLRAVHDGTGARVGLLDERPLGEAASAALDASASSGTELRSAYALSSSQPPDDEEEDEEEELSRGARARKTALAAAGSVLGAMATPKDTAARSMRAVRMWRTDYEDPVSIVRGLVRTRAPLREWERAKAPLTSMSTWSALDDLAREKGADPLIRRLEKCEGWGVRVIRLDPRASGTPLWSTLRLWGFTGADVHVASPWFDVLTLGAAGVGLRELYVDASLELRDLLDNRVPAGVLSQLAAVNGMPSPVPFMVRFMGMTPADLVAFEYTQEEWARLLGLDYRVLRKSGLFVSEKHRERLWRKRGWRRRVLVKDMKFRKEDARSLLPPDPKVEPSHSFEEVFPLAPEEERREKREFYSDRRDYARLEGTHRRGPRLVRG